MADWYISSFQYVAVSGWTASTTYSVGNITRPNGPSQYNKHSYRCTTAGVSGATEPTWSFATIGTSTTTSGTAVFTVVTGMSAYNWNAPAGSYTALNGRGGAANAIAAGDRLFFAAYHSESLTGDVTFSSGSTENMSNPVLMYAVNNLNIPPLTTDIVSTAGSGATIIAASGNLILDGFFRAEGFVFQSQNLLYIGASYLSKIYLKTCQLQTASATPNILFTNTSHLLLDNSSVKYGGCFFLGGNASTLDWFNTATPIVSTAITNGLFNMQATGGSLVTLRGLDLSQLISGDILINFIDGAETGRLVAANCKLASGLVIASFASALCGSASAELINCDSGSTNYRNERYTVTGNVITDTSITLVGGANDGVTSFSRKLVSTSYCEPWISPLESFPINTWNSATGSHTATIQIISSQTLTNLNCWVQLEYLGNASYPISSFADNFVGSSLTTASNIASSTASWAASPSTPVTQQLVVSFTALKVGWLRATVKLGLASTTMWVNPQMAIV